VDGAAARSLEIQSRIEYIPRSREIFMPNAFTTREVAELADVSVRAIDKAIE